MNFTKELIYNVGTDTTGWRCELSDFNSDGYPDFYLGGKHQYIFINDGTGNFNVVYQDNFGATDGTWPSDIDMDGDIDIVIANQWESPYGFFAYKNDGSGNFIFDTLIIMSNNYFTDGSIAADIDLDGLPDIAGVYKRVGYLRQYPFGTFTVYEIDALSNSHWVNVVPLRKCLPNVDLLVTDEGAHIIYENNMLLEFASLGYLESSILELTSAALEPCTLKYFGYNACVPNDTALAFYWRAGLDSADIDTNTWNGPYYAPVGMNVVDSFALSGTGRMFQYKAEFRGGNDIAVLYEVWLTYECSGLGVAEIPVSTIHDLKFVNGKLLLYLPREDQLRLGIYDVAGRLVKPVFDGYLPAGTHEFEVPKRTGIYFTILKQVQDQSTTHTRTLKFIKLK